MRNTILSLIVLPIIALACKQPDNRNTGIQPVIEPEMVLIPGGVFTMGNIPREDEEFIDNQAHKVYVDTFYLDKYEVTNAMYYEFCLATNHRLPEFWGMDQFRSSMNYPNHPVTGVCWSDAKTYADWKGLRLPTEAEWEYAARGGLEGMNYPNGNEMDSALANYYTTQGHPLKVGSYPVNGYGLYDMSGNVVEWVWDFYDDGYYLVSPLENPRGPLYGKQHCIRGGGWRSGRGCCSVHFRQSLRTYWVDFNVGFRCARDKDVVNNI
jgi:iron(II)-dependent oxidoreductase